jgi:hypothetical protein
LQAKLDALKNVENDKEELQEAIRDIEEQLKNMGVSMEDKDDVRTEYMDYRYLSTIRIFEVPEDGIFRFGATPTERKVKIVQFDDSIADKVKKMTVSECEELIQLDLTGLINLKKLTLKNSK